MPSDKSITNRIHFRNAAVTQPFRTSRAKHILISIDIDSAPSPGSRCIELQIIECTELTQFSFKLMDHF